MKIWYFHHYATPHELAGLHRPFDFGKYFRKDGDDVAVFTSSYLHYGGKNMINDKRKYFAKSYDGIETIFVKTSGYDNIFNRAFNMLGFALGLFGAAKWFGKNYFVPDVIVASSPHLFTMLAGLAIAKKMGVPCVCEVRDFWPEVFFLGGIIKEKSLIGKTLLWLERKIYEKSSRLVFLKEGDSTYITERGWDKTSGGKVDMSKCDYINNGVDLTLFDERKRQLALDDADLKSDKFKVVYCGTIRKVNNVDMLLDVAKELGNDTEILIYGSGNCEMALKERIQDEKITNVKLKGYVDGKYIPYILSCANVNVLNYSGSLYNWKRGSSSNKLFEYLASAVPVVSTVKIGYDIIEKYGCGLSADECSAKAVAQCIEKIGALPSDEYKNMCLNARKAAMEFDIPVLAQKYRKALVRAIDEFKK